MTARIDGLRLPVVLIACLFARPDIIRSHADEPKADDAHKTYWEKFIDSCVKFRPADMVSNPLESLRRYDSDCEFYLVFDPGKALFFKFVREGKEVVSLRGHEKTVFGVRKNVLYFVDYPTSSMGANVIAYDLHAGKQLWKAQLQAIGFNPSYSSRRCQRRKNIA